MSIPTRLRLAGWIISLTGAAGLVFGGGFNSDVPYVSMAGAVIMVLGIIVTSTAPLVGAMQERRRLAGELARHREGRSE